MSLVRIGSIFFALLIGLTIINYLEMFSLMQQKADEYTWAHLLIGLFFILNGLSVIGLLMKKQWGFYITYAAIIFSTVFFSTNYTPFIKGIIHSTYHSHLLFFCNGALLILISLFHVSTILKK